MRRQRGGETGVSAWLKSRWRALVITATVCAVFGLLSAVFLTRDAQIRRLRDELNALREEQRQAALEQDALRERLASSNDADVIEQEAREKLGLIMPGEVKVIFVGE